MTPDQLVLGSSGKLSLSLSLCLGMLAVLCSIAALPSEANPAAAAAASFYALLERWLRPRRRRRRRTASGEALIRSAVGAVPSGSLQLPLTPTLK